MALKGRRIIWSTFAAPSDALRAANSNSQGKNVYTVCRAADIGHP